MRRVHAAVRYVREKYRVGTGVALLALALSLAAWRVAADDARPGKPPKPPKPAELQKMLGGADRVLSFLSTDKPIYKPGETVHLRVVALAAHTYFPLRRDALAELTVTGPRGDEILRQAAGLADSVAGFAWTVPPGTPGGRYKAKVRVHRGAVAERDFEIRVYAPPRLKTQIEFLREGYGPGDAVAAVAKVTRAEGGAPAGARVTAIARVDGAEAARVENLAVDEDGACRAEFTLPAAIERGEGTLAFLIEDGGVVETATKTIPILLQTLDISFYPEGGELVAGLPARVYVQARRPDGKPADLVADLLRVEPQIIQAGNGDDDGGLPGRPAGALTQVGVAREIGEVRTTHEGRGVFSFTPEADAASPGAGARYALRIREPSGIARWFALPTIKAGGAAVHATREAYAFDEPIVLNVHATPAANARRVTLHKRERLLSEMKIKSDHLATDLSLDAKDAEGVLIATVWDAPGRPLAERLLFRRPKFALKLDLQAVPEPADGSPTPGGKIRLKVVARDENGRPVEAVVGLSVTDDALLEMVEKRDQAPDLPTMVHLENEVKDLADAHVYFDENNPDAARDIDLLLGTQGWRRFILARFDEILKTDPAAAARALARQDPPPIELALPKGRDRFAAPGRAAAGLDGEEIVLRNQAKELNDAPMPAAMPDVVERDGGVAVPVEAAEIREDAPMMPQPPTVTAGPVDAPAPFKAEAADAEKLRAPAADANFRAAGDDLRKKDLRQQEAEDEDNYDEAPAGELRRPSPFPVNAPEAAAASVPQRVMIREYAHQARAGRRPNDRVDFTETIYWNAGVRTNPRDGTAEVVFDLSDSVTTFRVRADAFAGNGALGAGRTGIVSVEPFHIAPKFPAVVVAGDVVELPVALVNATARVLDKPSLAVRADGLDFDNPVLPSSLAPGQRGRALVRFAAPKAGEYRVVMNAATDGHADTVTRTLTVLPRGFPIHQNASGLLGPDQPFAYETTIPDNVAAGSLRTSLKIHPTPLANMEEALNALLRQPHGCFEQASSTNYPLVMAQQYFIGHPGIAPDKIRRAGELLDQGYRKLVGYESENRGYEWFGGDPGHEALTAYGLLQFSEMARVMPVDAAMLDRTRAWLMDRRDGDGGFKRNDRALDSFGRAPPPLTNLYILWTLLESGQDAGKLAKEIDAARRRAAAIKDPYELALAANILHLAGDSPAARRAAEALRNAQAKGGDGGIDGAETSITRSGGEALKIETTSLAILAWLRIGDDFAGPVENAMAWLFEGCKAGRFGSTQSTILALKAINAYDAARARPKAPGTVTLKIDGQPFGKPLAFDEKSQSALELPDFTAALTPGTHKLELVMAGGGYMPFALEISYHTPQPANSDGCPLTISTALSNEKIAEGEPLEMKVAVTAPGKEVPMPLAIIGLPAGLEPRHERLKELVAAGAMDAYEIIGRELVLYWRVFRAGQNAELSIPLVAGIPGRYEAPASRVHAYYLEEHKQWAPGTAVTITPAGM